MPTLPAAGSGYLIVGLGDSVVSAIHCETPGCRGYPLVLADLATTKLGTVAAINLGRIHDFGTGDLLPMLRGEEFVKAAIRRADIITIGAGWNDWQGPCHWDDHDLCLSTGQDRAEQNLSAALDEIATLRAGQPTALRIVTYPDPYVGSPTAATDWGLTDTAKNADAVVAMFDAALRRFNAMLCSVARSHGGMCVDILSAFNGPTGLEPMPARLNNTQAQQDLIASLVDATGYAPLR